MATLRVPADYPSIAAAVAAAAPGDTIRVAGGYLTPETVSVSTDNLTFSGHSQASVTLTLAGASTIHVSNTLPFAVLGNDQGDDIYGSRAPNRLTGGGGDDQIHVRSGDDVDGQGGDDTFYLSSGPASLDGGQGNDVARVATSMSFAAGSVQNVELFSVVDGVHARFNDLGVGVTVRALTSPTGASTVRGGAFDDLFYSGEGADRFVGNAGNNMISYLFAASGVDVNLSNPSSNTGEAAGDTFFGVENLTGSNHSDVLVGNQNGNVIDGGLRNDTIVGGAGDTLIGGLGNDVFILDGAMSGAPASIEGDVAGVSDHDRGTNVVEVVGNTTVSPDFMLSNIRGIKVANGVEADFSAGHTDDLFVLYSSESKAGSSATIKTAASDHGASVVDGGLGADTLIGSDTNLTYFGLRATPTLVDGRAGGGSINLENSSVELTADNVRNVRSFTVYNGVDIDLSDLQYGVNIFDGSHYNQRSVVTGTDFNDTITTLNGDGVLTGGKGVDLLESAMGTFLTGSDTFIFHPGDTGITASTLDTITGFQTGMDHIHLDGIVPSVAGYAEATIETTNFGDARSKATSLMQSGSTDVVFIASAGAGDSTQPGWLFWNTDANPKTPDHAIKIQDSSSLAAFDYSDLT